MGDERKAEAALLREFSPGIKPSRAGGRDDAARHDQESPGLRHHKRMAGIAQRSKEATQSRAA